MGNVGHQGVWLGTGSKVEGGEGVLEEGEGR